MLPERRAEAHGTGAPHHGALHAQEGRDASTKTGRHQGSAYPLRRRRFAPHSKEGSRVATPPRQGELRHTQRVAMPPHRRVCDKRAKASGERQAGDGCGERIVARGNKS